MKNKTQRLLIAIFCFFTANVAISQQQLSNVNVQGVVYDNTNIPAVGVTVSIKDKPEVGNITDIDGKFKMSVKPGSTLLFSYIGFKTQEYIILKEELDIKIVLEEEDHQLTEAVVTGLGSSQRRISIVGAVTSVDTKDLQTPATSVTNMLGARVPGVISRLNSGEPGENISEFWIRGIGTFGGGTGALVLIDGIEGSINNIDPLDIESFSILKDASATAVYGVRGANGVILVTTKKGKTDKLRITARANLTLSYLKRLPKYLRAYDYANLANEAHVVRGDNPKYSETEMEIIKWGSDGDLYPDVDWQDEVLNKTSLQHTYYLSAQGGGSLARYFLSLGYSKEGSALKRDKNSKFGADIGFEKITYRANLDINMTPTTVVYFGVDGEYTSKNDPGMVNIVGTTSSSATQDVWLSQVMLTPLLLPTQYSTGQYPAFGTANGQYSPYVMLNNSGIVQREYYKSMVTLMVDQDLSGITKGLAWKTQVALTNTNWKNDKRFIRPGLWRANGRAVDGTLLLSEVLIPQSVEYSNWHRQDRKLHFESTINYENIFNEDHRVSALAYYYMTDETKNTSSTKASIWVLPYKYQGLSARATYSFKDSYFAEANFGYTGSANFKKGERFGFFPAIAVGWIPTNYNFMRKNLSWLDFFKIRFSYGLVGNDKIEGLNNVRFPYLTFINENAATGWGYLGDGLIENRIGADNLRWEKAKKTNLGFEGRLFDEKVEFTVDFYHDQRDGIFQERRGIPAFAGLSTIPYSNVGRMKSYGSDGNIAYHHTFNKDTRLSFRANYTYSTNKVQNFEQAYSLYPYKSHNNWPWGVARGYIALGLFKDEADVINSPAQNFGQTLMPGDIKYKDVNGDGVINDDDQVPISYSDTPRLQYGLGLELSHKSFTFGVRFAGTGKTDFFWVGKGGSGYTGGIGYLPFFDKEYGNVLELANKQSNRWTPAWFSGDPSTENPNARFPRLSYGNNENNTKLSTFWKGNAQYLKLSEVSASYNLVSERLKKIGISSMDITLVGVDLYTWDDVKIFDPDLARFVGGKYPIPARFTAQLIVNF